MWAPVTHEQSDDSSLCVDTYSETHARYMTICVYVYIYIYLYRYRNNGESVEFVQCQIVRYVQFVQYVEYVQIEYGRVCTDRSVCTYTYVRMYVLVGT